MVHQVKLKIGEEELILETGKMAKQAGGSVVGYYGGSSVLATVCCSSEAKEGLDFVPLSVDYNEKYYAAGKIPGGFIKREGRPKEKEILVSRLIDRPMRPLFHKAFGREIQVIPTTVSTDQIHTPDIVGMNAAFAAVMISDIPFNGPVGAVRVGSIDGELIINPTFEQIEESILDIIVAGTKEGITMVEGGAEEVSEELLLQAIEFAQGYIDQICDLQIEFAKLAGKEKLPFVEVTETFPLEDEVREFAKADLEKACFVKGKFERYAAIGEVKQRTLEHFAERMEEDQEHFIGSIFSDMEKKIVRTSILEKGERTDGRTPTDIRNITCEVDLLPRTHGSSLFTRGETQSLGVVTLGTVFDEQIMDDIDGDKRQRFMLHYNFPPFSVGETGRLGTGRREIGHGHLAHRSLESMLPSKGDFPYTIRVVSEVLESNGSSSMATVCSGTLSLLNAGVPMKRPVAGIAMGLISSEDKTVVLSDILGEEDHLGDMDFKVAGTEKGITAFQMDIKISGVTKEIMTTALSQAKDGRMHILSKMGETLGTPRDEISDYAPRIENLQVETDKIGMIIGPGGKNVKGISEKCDVSINIEDDGKISIYGKKKDGVLQAKAMLMGMVEEPEVGRIYQGTVKRIVDFGAFIEILPGKEGLCHISKLSKQRVSAVTDVLKEGQEVDVKLIEVDKMGRINLSYVDAQKDK